jgi:hypothetical protein
MRIKTLYAFIGILVVASMALAACQPAAPTTPEPAHLLNRRPSNQLHQLNRRLLNPRNRLHRPNPLNQRWILNRWS